MNSLAGFDLPTGSLALLVTGGLLWFAQPAFTQTVPAGGYGDPSTIDAAGLYAEACAPCHGRAGRGDVRGARLLGPALPRDFTTGVFKFRSTPAYSLPTDGDLTRTIRRGVPGTWMPAWDRHLTPTQVEALVAYLKGFPPEWSETEVGALLHIPSPPADTAGLVTEGRNVYVVLECWRCHGLTGRGDGPSARDLTDDWDRSIRPYDFTRGDYKAGGSSEDLYRTLVTGLSGTPMPAMEPDMVAFPGGGDEDLSALAGQLDAGTTADVEEFLSAQPSSAALQSLSDSELDLLLEKRVWALVYYVRSLERRTGFIRWLFVQNPELGSGGGQ